MVEQSDFTWFAQAHLNPAPVDAETAAKFVTRICCGAIFGVKPRT